MKQITEFTEACCPGGKIRMNFGETAITLTSGDTTLHTLTYGSDM